MAALLGAAMAAPTTVDVPSSAAPPAVLAHDPGVGGFLSDNLSYHGTLGKLGSEAVEGIDPGPLEAADAVGATWIQKMRWAVLPRALPEIVAFWPYRFEINIRASAILGVIGAGGVGSILSNTVSYRRWDKAGMTLLVVVGITLLVDAVSGGIRRRIIEGAPGDTKIRTKEVLS